MNAGLLRVQQYIECMQASSAVQLAYHVSMTDSVTEDLFIDEANAGQRVDAVLATLLPDFSRSRIARMLNEERILVDGRPAAPALKLKGGEQISVMPSDEPEVQLLPQAIDLDIRYQDDHLLVLNKPPGLVVHPGAGNPDGTMLNGLLHRVPALGSLPRAGLIHRLDKDTSGLLVVACSELAHRVLTKAMQARHIQREYLAVVKRVVTAGGTVDAPLARHPRDRKRIAVSKTQGGAARHAVSHYRVIERYRQHSLVSVKLETGRTHQIRVHMAHIGHPVLGDQSYGARIRMPQLPDAAAQSVVDGFRRQALHAASLRFAHPASNKELSFTADPPADMQALIAALSADSETVAGASHD